MEANKIQEILTCLNTCKNSKDIEFEMRFGQFKNNKFFPEISLENFITCNNFFSTISDKNICQEYSLIINYFNKTRVSQILEPPANYEILSFPWKGSKIIGERIVKKKNVNNIDDKEYNIRYSLSEEKECDYDCNGETPVFFKSRKRLTYFYKSMKIDLSMYKASEDINTLEMSDIKYDIEVEIIDPTKVSIISDICYVSEQILKIIQNTFVTMKFQEIEDVRKKYFEATRTRKFIGCQPETLNSCKVSRNTEYAMTIKLDGKRHLLFCNNKTIYLLDNKLNVMNTGATISSDKTFILDGEFFRGKFYCFDILFFNSDDVRSLNLVGRIEKIKYFINDVIASGKEMFVMKEYFFENIYQEIKNYENSENNETSDGIILVPINKPYPMTKNENVPLKWKPEIMNTIDFKIKKIGLQNKDYEVWDLYCSNNEKFTYYGFDELGTTTIPKETALNYMDNTVVEFFFDKNNEQFFPSKTRYDKKEGNYINVAVDNFNSTMKPCDIMSIFSTNKKINKNRISNFFDMRRFHNWIKRIMIDEGLKNEKLNKNIKLLDLCSGKGGDIHKWIDNNIRYVEGYDIDTQSIKECILRYNKMRQKPVSKNFDFNFYHKDLTKTNVESNENFDLITCFFAIHYFCESEETINKFVKNFTNLKEGGKILVTTLCSEKLKEINYSYATDDLIIKPVIPGKSISVFIKNTVLEKETQEFIVDKDVLIKIMEKNGFVLEDTKTFGDYYQDWKQNENFINYSDRKYSFLNRSYIFSKKNNPGYKNTYPEIGVWSETPVEDDSEKIKELSLKELRAYCKEKKISIENLKNKKQILNYLQNQQK